MSGGWEAGQVLWEWAGVQMVNEGPLENASGGVNGRAYPWGNEGPECNKEEYSDCDGKTVPVGSKPAGASPYTALDMAGNVWEWVADWYDGNYYTHAPERNPTGPDSGDYRVLRGGSWNDNPNYVRAANRIRGNPDGGNDNHGFRCAALPP